MHEIKPREMQKKGKCELGRNKLHIIPIFIGGFVEHTMYNCTMYNATQESVISEEEALCLHYLHQQVPFVAFPSLITR
jgi:hypothetical protein